MKSDVIRELLDNYAQGITWSIKWTERREVVIGHASVCDASGCDYVISVTPEGVFIGGETYDGRVRGLLTFLEMIFTYGRGDLRVDCTFVRESPDIAVRSIHICLFPEYTYESLRRVIRTCAVAKYSHVVLETWGSIQLDTMKELAWEDALTKEQVRSLVREAHALGMKVVPFFQHLGHASMARLSYSGKHVVLDQNPELEYLYYPKSYGWVWNFKSEEVRALLRNVRLELMDLFGEAEYFHLGCDEAGIEFDPDELCAYLNEVSRDLKAHGRRAVIWGDMLLSRAFFPGETYECNSTPDYASRLLEKLDKDVIIADWQYDTAAPSWSSSKLLKDHGFDVLCCPWDSDENLNASIQTVKGDGHLGVMKTTWNRLFSGRGIPSVVYYGLYCYRDAGFKRFEGHVGYITERSHFIYRKVDPEMGRVSYQEAGWSKEQV